MELVAKQIDVDGKSLYVEHYKYSEDKPTIVFLHDSLGCVTLWRDFPRLLAEAIGCNALVYDRLGYGKSAPMLPYERPKHYMELEADVLNNLLSKLDIESAILFGHSDGGTIALLTANKYPYRVQKVICEAAHVFVEEVTLKGILEAMDAYANTDLPERLEKYHGDKVEMLFNAWTKTWTRADFRDWDIIHLLSNIACPLLFIQGEADEYGTLAQVDQTITNVSGKAQKYIIPDVGHTPHKETPELVLDKVIAFLAEN